MPRRKTNARRSMYSGKARPRARRPEGARRWHFLAGERLEERRLLSGSPDTQTPTVVYTVGTQGIDGGVPVGSLETAIILADATSAADNVVINFNLALAGPVRILVDSNLPEITRPMIIDGTTELTYTGSPLVELAPSAANTKPSYGLQVDAAKVVIQGLSIVGFDDGIDLESGATGDVIRGDYLGVRADGASDGNLVGILLSTGADGNAIGGAGTFTDANGHPVADRNLISGNRAAGVDVDAGADNRIQGNFIGTDSTGMKSQGNAVLGVSLEDGAVGNLIGGAGSAEGNTISGNGGDGVAIWGSDTSNNDVQGNFIGIDASGTGAVPNAGAGVAIQSGASGNLIGGIAGNASFPGNVISGNTQQGVLIDGGGTSGISSISGNSVSGGNTIQGNLIGTDSSGTKALGNGGDGIEIDDGATGNLVGGAGPDEGNVVSANGADGVELTGGGTTGNQVQSNFIGTDAAGTRALGNNIGVAIESGAADNLIGGTRATGTLLPPGNLISGNMQQGVLVSDSENNTIQGNVIGTDASGAKPLGNGADGIDLLANANANQIGGTSQLSEGLLAGDGNLISGNTHHALLIDNSSNNLFQGNYVGTDLSGTVALANDPQTAVGGIVVLDDGASDNTIGGVSNRDSGGNLSGFGNLISGNNNDGVWIGATVTINPGTSATGNTVEGNWIGIDATGERALGNQNGTGVELAAGAANNAVGGAKPGEGNVISANGQGGIAIIGCSQNRVQGNLIGTDAGGEKALGNQGDGVDLENNSSNNLVGGTGPGDGNVIAFNSGDGVVVGLDKGDDASTGDAIRGNSIFANGKLGIDLGDDGVTRNTLVGPHSGPNDLQNYPVLEPYTTPGSISGTLFAASDTTFEIDFYANPKADPSGHGQGEVYLGSTTVTTDTGGVASFTFSFTPVPGDPILSATATDPNGNTSEFSQDVGSSLQASTGSVGATEGAAFSGSVATFTDGNPAATTADFTATITWGDGNSSAGTVTGGTDGTFQVSGAHTYAKAGQETLAVVVSDNASNTVTATGNIVVSDAQLSATLAALSLTEGSKFSGAVATFTDGNPAGTTADFSAMIHWGDGGTSAGSVSGANGTFTVVGSHTYAVAGQDMPVTVTINDVDGASATAAGAVKVADLSLSAAGTTLAVLPGAPLSNVTVATFTDANPLATAADFTASINWGDGSSPAGTVTETAGTFSVAGSHTYSDTTNDSIVVTVFDQGGATAQATSTGEVGDPNAQFVAAAYLDVLGRPVDAGGLAYWDQQLDAGQSRTVVSNLIDHSAEYFGNIIITPAYSHYLLRAPDAAGLAYWVDQMQNHGLTDEELEAGFISSPEFYADAGKQHPGVSNDEAWVDALYQTFLGRQPDQQGLNYWDGQLSGGQSGDQVALGFAASLERARQRISDDYFHYLGRGPDQQGLDYWANQFAGGVTNEDLITDFVASDEYFAKHTG